MELGDLELLVLRAVRTLREGSSGEVWTEVRRTRDVAYTSVTTTLYRLVDKDLIAVRRQSEKRALYRIKNGRAYRRALTQMADSLLDTFGGAAVSYLLENPERLSVEQAEILGQLTAARRAREETHG